MSILLRYNRKCLDGVYYQVPRVFLLSSSKRHILLIRCGVYSRAAFIGNFTSASAAFNRINTVIDGDEIIPPSARGC